MIVSNELGIECVIFCTEQGTNSSGMKMSTEKRKREREDCSGAAKKTVTAPVFLCRQLAAVYTIERNRVQKVNENAIRR